MPGAAGALAPRCVLRAYTSNARQVLEEATPPDRVVSEALHLAPRVTAQAFPAGGRHGAC